MYLLFLLNTFENQKVYNKIYRVCTNKQSNCKHNKKTYISYITCFFFYKTKKMSKNLSRLNKKKLIALCKQESIKINVKDTKKQLIKYLSKKLENETVIDLNFQTDPVINNIVLKKVDTEYKNIISCQSFTKNTKRQKILKNIIAFKFKKKSNIPHINKMYKHPKIHSFIKYNEEIYKVMNLSKNIFGEYIVHVVNEKKKFSTKYKTIQYNLKSRKFTS